MERRAILVRGTVQGVGFRPFVYGLAARLGLSGFVRNQTSGVLIEIQGEAASLDEFVTQLRTSVPPLARIDALCCEPRPLRPESQFQIKPSADDACGSVVICADVATCDDCLAELFDPSDRRFRYPFLNCTNCGPRLTIVTAAPYDRAHTTMREFRMCADCRAEYENPADRRFHAQPIACPACGPRLTLLDGAGKPIEGGDPLLRFAEALRAGQIGTLKGLGGYHLACDARHEAAVDTLRRRKQRDEKPFALMVRDLAGAEALCELSPAERLLLSSPERPIVLLRRRPDARVAGAVAPGNPCLGIMLPYTPLHHLLADAMDNAPLVMTSGNRSDEPLAYRDADALQRLAGIADLFLTHNRPIHIRCDDSVTQMAGGLESPLRRSRGYVPQPLSLPVNCPQPILATGGQMKVTFALGRERQAILSQHMGDLDDLEAYRAFERDIGLYEQLFQITPACIVHDLHPDYASTRYASFRARAGNLQRIAVQHHHAHLASVMAEHGLTDQVIGVIFDGTGFGTDGAIWGGEFLIGNLIDFQRAAHLRYVAMPGSEQAIREPWRMALAHLLDAGESATALQSRIDAESLRVAQRMIERNVNAPWTSSVGRLFDAVAALLGVRDRISYEGQAAVELEWLAGSTAAERTYPFRVHSEAPGNHEAFRLIVDSRPLIQAIVHDVRSGAAPAQIARQFHSTLAQAVLTVCELLRERTGVGTVVLSGGVFMNARLAADTAGRLIDDRFRVYRQTRVPPGDGGLSLGQLAIGAARLSGRIS